MHFPVPDFHPNSVPEIPALVRNALREDVQWNRPIFKAPPLELNLPGLNPAAFAEDLRRVTFGPR